MISVEVASHGEERAQVEGDACGAVLQIMRYPVKSMHGEHVVAARVDERGVGGDRIWAVWDVETGKIASAKLPRRWGALLTCHAVFVDAGRPSGVAITLPDRRRVNAGEDEANAALSDLLGRPVSLVSQPPDVVEIERYWPDVKGFDQRDTVTENTIAAAAPGTFFDFAPIHLVTTATLAHLRAFYPGGRFPIARFRPNLVIEHGETHGWVENGWVGRALLIGCDVRLRVLTPTPRCVVPTLEQPGVPRDLGVLRAIAAHNRPPIPPLAGRARASLGVYALIERPGVIRAGDTIRVLPDA